ncbi:MAG: EAL domain-containing protein [Aquificaceae bacterium]|nr:EAL domain-containing protein [Aquificaceae bacterium]
MARKNLSFLELYQGTLVSNKGCLLEYMQKLIYLYERRGEVLSLILLDVDNMKQINKELGYDQGNRVLFQISEIIRISIRRSDIAGKYKGSSFLILLPNADAEGVEKVARRIRNRIKAFPFRVDIRVTISVYSFVPQGDRAEEILDLMETHVASKKMSGGDGLVIVGDRLEKRTVNHKVVIEALEKRAVRPAFQPIYNLQDKRVEGYEVLMRLVKEDGTVVPAGCFIEDLLKTSLIEPFEEMVIQEAFYKFKSLGLEGRLFINFPYSFVNFMAKGKLKVLDFYKEVVSHGIEPSSIVLELSEGKITASTEDLVEMVEEVRSYGFGIAVDDFGVEYSSIERLIKTNPDIVKLDGFFLRDGYVLRWVIKGLKMLNLKIVAEQVETEEELELIKASGADMVQGFYLGKPQVL